MTKKLIFFTYPRSFLILCDFPHAVHGSFNKYQHILMALCCVHHSVDIYVWCMKFEFNGIS